MQFNKRVLVVTELMRMKNTLNKEMRKRKKNEGGGECWVMEQTVLLNLNKKGN